MLELFFETNIDRSKCDLSLITLKTVSVLIQIMGPGNFVSSFIGLKQDIKLKYNSKLRPKSKLNLTTEDRWLSLCDFPEQAWPSIYSSPSVENNIIEVTNYITQLSSSDMIQNMVCLNLSEEFLVDIDLKGGLQFDLWNCMLTKLEDFMSNKPPENVIIFEILLGLITPLDLSKIVQLQWAMYLMRFS